VIAALALLLLPLVLSAIGLGVTSAIEVVVFSLACMALNILVGYTGLTSFGHGAWFGLAAYAAGMSQRHWFAGSFVMPVALGLAIVVALAAAFGFLILRRRGVYFSLLTLALSAMLYSVAFRWTDVTGGENGLGGITRPTLFGLSFESAASYYALVAGVAFVAVLALWRFHRSPLGSVLVAIRENEQRARFVGYPTDRVKLAAFVASAGLTAQDVARLQDPTALAHFIDERAKKQGEYAGTQGQAAARQIREDFVKEDHKTAKTAEAYLTNTGKQLGDLWTVQDYYNLSGSDALSGFGRHAHRAARNFRADECF